MERESERPLPGATTPVPIPPSRLKFTQFKVSLEPQLLVQIKELARSGHLTLQELTNTLLKAGLSVYQGTQPDPKAVYLGTQNAANPEVHRYTLFNDLDLKDRSDDLRSIDRSDLQPNSVYQGTQVDAKETEALAFYSKKTGRKVTEHDRRAYRKGYTSSRGFAPAVSHLPINLIKRGILDSIVRCKGEVGTFAYCLGAIHQTVEEHMREYKDWAVGADEEINKLRMKSEARGNQEMLPTVGAELVELPRSTETEEEREERIRRDLGYQDPNEPRSEQ